MSKQTHLIWRLWKLWRRCPELRFCQLLVNIALLDDDTHAPRIFYMPDERFLSQLTKFERLY